MARPSTSEALHWRTRVVGAQLEKRWRATQLSAPVVKLFVEPVALEPFPLPDGEVGILNGQLRKRWLAVCDEGLVEFGELLRKDPPGPPVRDDVMQHDRKEVIVVGDSQQIRPDQQVAPQVKWSRHL